MGLLRDRKLAHSCQSLLTAPAPPLPRPAPATPPPRLPQHGASRLAHPAASGLAGKLGSRVPHGQAGSPREAVREWSAPTSALSVPAPGLKGEPCKSGSFHPCFGVSEGSTTPSRPLLRSQNSGASPPRPDTSCCSRLWQSRRRWGQSAFPCDRPKNHRVFQNFLTFLNTLF